MNSKIAVKILLCGLTIGVLLTSMTARAAGTCTVGYVSLDRLIAESTPAKKARASLDKEFKPRERALEKQAADIRSQQQKYEKDFPDLNNEQRAAREADITKAAEAFDTQRASFETELSNAQNALLQDFLKSANKVIRDYAEKNGFEKVDQEAVYIKPECDITQKVIDSLN